MKDYKRHIGWQTWHGCDSLRGRGRDRLVWQAVISSSACDLAAAAAAAAAVHQSATFISSAVGCAAQVHQQSAGM